MGTVFHFPECPLQGSCWPIGDELILTRGLNGILNVETEHEPQDEHEWTNEHEHECSRCSSECLCDIVELTLRRVIVSVRHMLEQYDSLMLEKQRAIGVRRGRPICSQCADQGCETCPVGQP